ncbi:AgmX/PglI C-terminal domain-containing protein [Bacterioplanoides sp. SCSIO 12839]|uniref:AgmX/PglI C-terminal domain-containing protein n=1 Tax=Bacterioplanoides sp. SCSIO 12839 TaxID=2829569 RepID=UPI0021066875|nr:AgmX/PglI C-terminal domain-containing protein [Bacterioplanoides sp. SCSIO 12839]UTW48450.1 AgmX/PglI C-terminal domain-containing protein [Bacterioplanoides sp. SCSIO 12839]
MTETTAKPLDHLALDIVLPWHEDQQQTSRYQKLVKRIVIPVMAFMLVMPLLPDLTGDVEVEKKVVTKLVLDQPEPELVEQVAEPEPVKPQAVKPKPKPSDKEQKAAAPQQRADLQALTQQLTALRSKANTPKRQKKNVLVAKSGKVQKSSRSLLGQKNALSSSSGLASSELSVDGQALQLGGHESGTIDSPIMAVDLPTENEYYEPEQESRRDMQSIRRTLERHKGSVYALYTKALRQNPELNGRFIFEFVILPNGEVAKLKIKSSELDNQPLEQKMLDKIRLIQFGQQSVIATAVQYTFTFVPS